MLNASELKPSHDKWQFQQEGILVYISILKCETFLKDINLDKLRKIHRRSLDILPSMTMQYMQKFNSAFSQAPIWILITPSHQQTLNVLHFA